MRITRLYADEDGETHFEEVEIPLEDRGATGRTSRQYPATGIIFREVPPTYDYDWHNAPRRQYVVNLDNGVEIRASDGSVRRFQAGDIMLAEDTHGKGHVSKAINEQVRHCLFVTLD